MEVAWRKHYTSVNILEDIELSEYSPEISHDFHKYTVFSASKLYDNHLYQLERSPWKSAAVCQRLIN
jgi:hypothetical protein